MAKQIKKTRKQRGFTLVELLVVIGIIAALAAVVIPNVARFAGRGNTEANNTELEVAQAAMDTYMAENNLSVVAALLVGAAADNFSAAAIGGTVLSPVTLYPQFMRQNPTKCQYYWPNGDGEVFQAAGSC